ncbi:MAG: DUF445 family protein [Bdellovibrionales bacterium]|nr:DUF445 family protein [Bdellovibrionales bacterium]
MIYLLPFVAALIGWLTNYLAVRMLFHPRKKINLLVLKLQGVFPKRQAALAKKLGEVVSEELFSASDVQRILTEAAKSDKARKLLELKFEELISNKLPNIIPMISMVLNPILVQSLKALFLTEMEQMIDQAVVEMGDEVEKRFDIHEIVEEKVKNFSSDKLESLILSIMRKELRFVEIVGGVLGFFIGCAQLGILYLEGTLPPFQQFIDQLKSFL